MGGGGWGATEPIDRTLDEDTRAKVIITRAVTGAIHTPSLSPHLPVTPEEIADAEVGAAEAGAAIIHLHARDPATGRPDQSVEAFRRVLPDIRTHRDAVVNLTTGGAPAMTLEERLSPAATLKPEVASLNMGSMNFGLFPMSNRYREFAAVLPGAQSDRERLGLSAGHKARPSPVRYL